MYIHIYIHLNHCAIYLKLIWYYKSATVQFLKNLHQRTWMDEKNYKYGRQNRKGSIEILALSRLKYLIGEGARTRGNVWWCHCFSFFNLNYLFILLYNIVLVLPYIDLNQPWVYTCSPSWTPLPNSLPIPSLWVSLWIVYIGGY